MVIHVLVSYPQVPEVFLSSSSSSQTKFRHEAATTDNEKS